MPVSPDATDFNKPSEAGSHLWLHVLNGLLLAGLWAFTIWAWPRLPDLVPGHIGLSGVTRWDAKQNSLWFILPIMGSVHAVIMYGISTLADGSAQSFNMPQKKRVLALPKEGQRFVMQPMRGFMYGMATWLLALMFYIQYSFYRAAMESRTGEPDTGGMLPVIGLMLVVVFVMVGWLNRSANRRIAEWDRRNPGSTVAQ
jgi:uncharacterized membrane protein